MNYQLVTVGAMQTNAYIIIDENSGQCAVIDPGSDGEKIAAKIKEQNLSLEKILLTHGHFDHIGGIDALKKEFPNVKTYIHEKDAEMLQNPNENLSFLAFSSITAPAADCFLKGGEELEIGETALQVIHTPGHSAGSVAYLAEGVLFGGDTLFYESIGRYDFGSYEEIMHSLDQLLSLPKETKVMPGHGPDTTLDHERKFNPYLR